MVKHFGFKVNDIPIKRKILISSSVNFSVNVSLNVPRVGDSNLDVSGRYYESISESIQADIG